MPGIPRNGGNNGRHKVFCGRKAMRYPMSETNLLSVARACDVFMLKRGLKPTHQSVWNRANG
jgi:hypothetical protein